MRQLVGALSRRFVTLAFVVSLLVAHPPVRAETTATPDISFQKQATAASFEGSTVAGIVVGSRTGGADVRLAPAGLRVGRDKTIYSRAYWYGTLESRELPAAQPFDTVVASWNAQTPAGTWLQLELRAYRARDSHWTKYYNLGIWASGTGTIKRRSVGGQGNADGKIATDSLNLSAVDYTRYQYRLTLFTTNRRVSPSVSLVAVVTSNSAQQPSTLAIESDREAWGVDLNLPQRSQMIYKGGGEVWCSPTSTSMVLAYWGTKVPVPTAAALTYDHTYRGNGNWPFNTAWAATYGYEAYVTRMSSMAQVEEWISAKVPVVMSYAMSNRELAGAPYSSTRGHIMVIRGFTADGDVIVNDPAFGSDATVRTVYNRAKLEELWLKHSGGTVYLIYPKGWSIPSDKVHGSW